MTRLATELSSRGHEDNRDVREQRGSRVRSCRRRTKEKRFYRSEREVMGAIGRRERRVESR